MFVYLVSWIQDGQFCAEVFSDKTRANAYAQSLANAGHVRPCVSTQAVRGESFVWGA
jgi:hypothetical protein